MLLGFDAYAKFIKSHTVTMQFVTGLLTEVSFVIQWGFLPG